MTIGERIKKIRKESDNKTRKAFADSLGIAENYVYMLETGRADVKERVKKDICKTYGVRYDWLEYETGDVYEDNSDIQTILDAFMTCDDAMAVATLKILAQQDDRFWAKAREVAELILKESNGK